MKYDTTLKEIFQRPPQRLLQMLIGGEAVEMLTVEFPAVRMRRADLVVRLSSGRIYHLELQTENDETMIVRMLEYYFYIRRLYGQGPIQQVLYVGKERMTMSAEINDEMLKYSYQIIDIRELDGAPLLASETLEDNLIAILCRVDEIKVAIKQIMAKIAQLTGKQRGDALIKLLILAGLRDYQQLVKEEAKEMSITLDIEQNAFLKEVFQEGEQKGIEKGIEKGESALLRRLLERKFGELPVWAEDQIASADVASLERWGLQLLDAASLAEALK
jgi:predicted transposase YdaD